MLNKNIWAKFQRILKVFTQIIFTMLSNIWVWDPRSGIRKKPIPDPGSRGQQGTGSRIRIRNTVCNNLSSHVSLKVISLCRENNIEYVCLPPNSMYKMQPLDEQPGSYFSEPSTPLLSKTELVSYCTFSGLRNIIWSIQAVELELLWTKVKKFIWFLREIFLSLSFQLHLHLIPD